MRLIAIIAPLLTSLSMAFEPPTPEVRRAAVGDLSALPAVLQKAFAPDDGAFESIPAPRLTTGWRRTRRPGIHSVEANRLNRRIKTIAADD
jgi:hypothetical protein